MTTEPLATPPPGTELFDPLLGINRVGHEHWPAEVEREASLQGWAMHCKCGKAKFMRDRDIRDSAWRDTWHHT